jgi:hypothetical protein
MTDLTVAAFHVLREVFFGARAVPTTYALRDKRNTQGDPLDEYIQLSLSKKLPRDVQCFKASGPLITPDLVLARPASCNGTPRESLRDDLARIVGVEVKKLERRRSGTVARASGMDFNTTPPCGTVRVYDRNRSPFDIKGFYLFVCQEAVQEEPGYYRLTAMTLCDGDLLNADFELYLSIVGRRTKAIGLGTYGDGADRKRPMLIFANPLGAPFLDHQVTLVHARADLGKEFPRLRRVAVIRRTIPDKDPAVFHCYRVREDVPARHSVVERDDPFPQVARTDRTQARGQFRLEITPGE